MELTKTEVADRSKSRLQYSITHLACCLIIHTTEDFNKDYTVNFDDEKSRDDWMTAIMAAKENKPIFDSVNRAFVMKSDDDITEDWRTYFNRMLTSFNANYLDDNFQDILLRLSSFFHRAVFSVFRIMTSLTFRIQQVLRS